MNCLEFAIDVLKSFGFEEYRPSFPPGMVERAASISARRSCGETSEDALKRATERLKLKVTIVPDEAAFYGPKIDMKLLDALGRKWQLSTVQFDWNLPGKFGLEYVAEDGKRHQPMMVHRACTAVSSGSSES